MERSGNFYKAIRLGYILISILIGCMEDKKQKAWNHECDSKLFALNSLGVSLMQLIS